MPTGPFAATPWDVLLASAGSGLLTRVVLQPVTSWSGASFSSVMPLGYEGGVWWLRARMAFGMDGAGLSLDTITDRIGRGGVQFDVEQANGTGGFRPLGRLSDDPASDVSFDPTLHCPPGCSCGRAGSPTSVGLPTGAAKRRSIGGIQTCGC